MTKEQTENHCCKKEKQEQRKKKRMYRKKACAGRRQHCYWNVHSTVLRSQKLDLVALWKTYTHIEEGKKNERRQMNFLWEINKNLAFIIHIMSTIPLRLHQLNRHSIWFREQFRADLYGSLISFVECFIRYVNTPFEYAHSFFRSESNRGEKRNFFPFEGTWNLWMLPNGIQLKVITI